MSDWDGLERRKGYLQMEDRLRDVEKELATLNGSLPEFQRRIDSAISKIDSHEANASTRWNEHLKCMVEREKATDSIKILWVVVTSILLINAGMIVTLAMKAFAR